MCPLPYITACIQLTVEPAVAQSYKILSTKVTVYTIVCHTAFCSQNGEKVVTVVDKLAEASPMVIDFGRMKMEFIPIIPVGRGGSVLCNHFTLISDLSWG